MDRHDEVLTGERPHLLRVWIRDGRTVQHKLFMLAEDIYLKFTQELPSRMLIEYMSLLAFFENHQV